jgi:hypothetical protein
MSLSVRPPVEQNCRRCNSPVARSKNFIRQSDGGLLDHDPVAWLQGEHVISGWPVLVMGRMPGAVRDCHAGPAESSIAIAMAHPSMSALGQ